MSRSIIPDDREGVCWICSHYGKPPEMLGRWSAPIEKHHIFDGPNRKKSEHYGLTVHLCIYHHRQGSEAVHNNAQWRLILERTAQKAFEEKYGPGTFVQEFGKSYL